MEPKIPQEEIERVKKTLRDYTERVTSGEIAFHFGTSVFGR